MKWYKAGVGWGGPDNDWYHIYWWNPLSKNTRYFGYVQYYYDGPIHTFGLWFTNIVWQTPWW